VVEARSCGDARLRGKMQYRINITECFEVVGVDVCDDDIPSSFFDITNVELFDTRIIVRIKIVDADHLITASQKRFGNM
jgi:hypothetical protein